MSSGEKFDLSCSVCNRRDPVVTADGVLYRPERSLVERIGVDIERHRAAQRACGKQLEKKMAVGAADIDHGLEKDTTPAQAFDGRIVRARWTAHCNGRFDRNRG